MNRMGLYVFRQLVVGMVMVTAGLTCVIWLMQSLRFVEMIVNRGLTVGTFLYMTMLMLPNFLPIVLPIALFTVVVFIYSKMSTDRELIIMRGAGLSQWALAKPAILLGLIVVVLIYALNLFVMPESWRKFREMQWAFRHSFAHVVLQEGAFNALSADITVYVRERSKDGQLRGLLVHDNRNKEKPTTYMAERGALVESGAGARLVLFEGNRQEMERETGRLSLLYFDRSAFDLEDVLENPEVRYREASERTLDELLNVADDPSVVERDYGKFTVEAHKRLSSPLLAMGFNIVALACMLSGTFSRRSQSHRVILAISLLIAIQASVLAIQYYSARNLSWIPVLYVSAILPSVVGYAAMLRARDWDWRRRRTRPAVATS
ncbi:MAG: LPS export ABC transporter permease LptF [Rhodospirillales bacterium]|nr:LPS export ABC transporter permease LptF [Rhodospirillales bacterium]